MADPAYNLEHNRELEPTQAEKLDKSVQSLDSLFEHHEINNFLNQEPPQIDFSDKESRADSINKLIDGLFVDKQKAKDLIANTCANIIRRVFPEEAEKKFLHEFITSYINEIEISEFPVNVEKIRSYIDGRNRDNPKNRLQYELNRLIYQMQMIAENPLSDRQKSKEITKIVDQFIGDFTYVVGPANLKNNRDSLKHSINSIVKYFITSTAPYLKEDTPLRQMELSENGLEDAKAKFKNNAIDLIKESRGQNKMAVIEKYIRVSGADYLINNIEELNLLENDKDFNEFILILAKHDPEAFTYYFDKLEIEKRGNIDQLFSELQQSEPELSVYLLGKTKLNTNAKLDIYTSLIHENPIIALAQLADFSKQNELEAKEQDLFYEILGELQNKSDELDPADILNYLSGHDFAKYGSGNDSVSRLYIRAIEHYKYAVIEKMKSVFLESFAFTEVSPGKMTEYLNSLGIYNGISNVLAYCGSTVKVPEEWDSEDKEARALEKVQNYIYVGVRKSHSSYSSSSSGEEERVQMEPVDPDIYKEVINNLVKQSSPELLSSVLEYLQTNPDAFTRDKDFYVDFFLDVYNRQLIDPHSFFDSFFLVFLTFDIPVETKNLIISDFIDQDLFSSMYVDSDKASDFLNDDHRFQIIEKQLALSPEQFLENYSMFRPKNKKREFDFISQKIKQKIYPFSLFSSPSEAISFFLVPSDQGYALSRDFNKKNTKEKKKAIKMILELKKEVEPSTLSIMSRVYYSDSKESYHNLDYLLKEKLDSFLPLLADGESVLYILSELSKIKNKKQKIKTSQNSIAEIKKTISPKVFQLIKKLNISLNFPLEIYKILDSTLSNNAQIDFINLDTIDTYELEQFFSSLLPSFNSENIKHFEDYITNIKSFLSQFPKPRKFDRGRREAHTKKRHTPGLLEKTSQLSSGKENFHDYAVSDDKKWKHQFTYYDNFIESDVDVKFESTLKHDHEGKKSENMNPSQIKIHQLVALQLITGKSLGELFSFFNSMKNIGDNSSSLVEFITMKDDGLKRYNYIRKYNQTIFGFIKKHFEFIGRLELSAILNNFYSFSPKQQDVLFENYDEITKGYNPTEVFNLLVLFQNNCGHDISNPEHLKAFTSYLGEYSLNSSEDFFKEYLNLSLGNEPSLNGSLLGVKDKGKTGLNQLRNEIRTVYQKFIQNSVFDTHALGIDIENPIVWQYLRSITRIKESEWGNEDLNLSEVITSIEKNRKSGEVKPLPDEYQNFDFSVEEAISENEQGYMMADTSTKKFLALSSEILDAIYSIHNSNSNFEGSDHFGNITGVLGSRVGDEIELLTESLPQTSPERLDFIKDDIKSREELVPKLSDGPDQLIKALLDFSIERKINKSNHYSARTIRQILFAKTILSDESYSTKLRKISSTADAEIGKQELSELIEVINNQIVQHIVPNLSLDKNQKKKLSKILNTKALKDEIRRINQFNSGRQKNIQTVFSRDVLAELTGYYCDACWTSRTDLMKNKPNMLGFGFDMNGILIGGGLLIESQTEDGEKVLIIRGINPRQNYITQLNPGDFIESFCDKLEVICKKRGIKKILVPVKNEGALSNRPEIVDYFETEYGNSPITKLDNEEEFNSYKIGEKCVTIREIK